MEMSLGDCFDLRGRTAVITGGAGVLCSEMARALSSRGVRVAVLDLDLEKAQALATCLCSSGAEGAAFRTNVMDRESLEAATGQVLTRFERVDLLINGAGGNQPAATTSPQCSFFELPSEALDGVIGLNLLGTILPCQVFGRFMRDQGEG